jgi:hypothetical protein
MGDSPERPDPPSARIGQVRTSFRYATILALLFFARDASAQAIVGRLIDAETGGPIADATIALIDETGSPVAGTLTDPNGAFRVALPSPGTVVLRAQRIGYRGSATEPLTIGREETVELEVRLSTEAVLLDPVTVITESRPWWEAERDPRVWGFYDRMDRLGRTGVGRFITAEDLVPLSGLPGWMILTSPLGFGIQADMAPRGTVQRSISIRGPLRERCNPVYFLDGLPFRAGEAVVHTTIETLAHEDRLEGIEMFSPWYVPSEFASFLRHDERCVVSIWTRDPKPGPWDRRRP